MALVTAGRTRWTPRRVVAELVADAISSRACVLATVVSLDEAREPNAVAEDEGHG